MGGHLVAHPLGAQGYTNGQAAAVFRDQQTLRDCLYRAAEVFGNPKTRERVA